MSASTTIPAEPESEPAPKEKGLLNRIFDTVCNEAADFVDQEVSIAKEKISVSAKTAVHDAIPLVVAAVAVLVAVLLLLVGIGAAVGVLFTYTGLSPLAAAAAGMLSTAAVITVVAVFTIKWALHKFSTRDYPAEIPPEKMEDLKKH